MVRTLRNAILTLNVLIVISCVVASAQDLTFSLPRSHEKIWQRVLTGPDSNIDVKTASLVLEPNRLFRSQFRTTFARSEESFEKPGTKYKTRLETFQFDAQNDKYRVIETTLFDSSEKIVYESGPLTTRSWKPLRGQTVARLYETAAGLHPLGTWTTIGIWAAGSEQSASSEELQGRLSLHLNRFATGRTNCTAPRYESVIMRGDDFSSMTGREPTAAGFPEPKIAAVRIRCEPKTGSSELHILFLAAAGRATLLSSGVVYDLQK